MGVEVESEREKRRVSMNEAKSGLTFNGEFRRAATAYEEDYGHWFDGTDWF